MLLASAGINNSWYMEIGPKELTVECQKPFLNFCATTVLQTAMVASPELRTRTLQSQLWTGTITSFARC